MGAAGLYHAEATVRRSPYHQIVVVVRGVDNLAGADCVGVADVDPVGQATAPLGRAMAAIIT